MTPAEIEAALPLLKRVPYSLHCNFLELQAFVAHLQPQAIAPVVSKVYDARYPIDPNIHFKHLLREAAAAAAGNAAVVQSAPGRAKQLDLSAEREGQQAVKRQHGRWQVSS